jgi:tetrapyrrole methylase family protein/MazG family protein
VPARPPKSKRKEARIPKARKTKLVKSTARKIAVNAPAQIGELFAAFVALQARLRAPGGCPWDREQTHASLRTYLIEETYEVLDALDSGNGKEFAEELGDLLLQIVFHADMAREAGTFNISDVITGIHEKMVRRHPHVFGTVKAATPAQVLKNWDQLKKAEKRGKSAEDNLPKQDSILDGVPKSLPALLEAYQLTRRAAKVGFDWHNVEGILEKLIEESAELRAAIAEGKQSDIEGEVGDLLFVAVNLARFIGLDPEVALKGTNRKFTARFHDMELSASRMGTNLAKLSKDELEALWNSAKMRTKSSASRRGHP